MLASAFHSTSIPALLKAAEAGCSRTDNTEDQPFAMAFKAQWSLIPRCCRSRSIDTHLPPHQGMLFMYLDLVVQHPKMEDGGEIEARLNKTGRLSHISSSRQAQPLEIRVTTSSQRSRIIWVLDLKGQLLGSLSKKKRKKVFSFPQISLPMFFLHIGWYGHSEELVLCQEVNWT